MNLYCKSKNSFSSLSQIGIQFSTDTIFIVAWALGGKQPLEAKQHEKMQLSKFVVVLDIVEMKFWNSLPLGATGQEGAYSS